MSKLPNEAKGVPVVVCVIVGVMAYALFATLKERDDRQRRYDTTRPDVDAVLREQGWSKEQIRESAAEYERQHNLITYQEPLDPVDLYGNDAYRAWERKQKEDAAHNARNREMGINAARPLRFPSSRAVPPKHMRGIPVKDW